MPIFASKSVHSVLLSRYKSLLARALQALSDPYCQLKSLSLCLSVCVSETLMLNMSEIRGSCRIGTHRRVPMARRLVTSSMTLYP